MGATEIRYTGQCRGRFADITAAEQITGRKAALRFQVKEGLVAVKDEFSGPHPFDVYQVAGDFPILRRDKIPSYQLAVVVDDAYDGVTEVVRGDDLLPSAARQMLIAEALGFEIPRYYHVPLVVDDTGRRLAKRCDDLGISTLRDAGVDPRAVVEWVAYRSGFFEVGRVSPRELLSNFDWGRVERSPVTFDDTSLHQLLMSR
jgi:glutamyl-tRNA synthetase